MKGGSATKIILESIFARGAALAGLVDEPDAAPVAALVQRYRDGE